MPAPRTPLRDGRSEPSGVEGDHVANRASHRAVTVVRGFRSSSWRIVDGPPDHAPCVQVEQHRPIRPAVTRRHALMFAAHTRLAARTGVQKLKDATDHRWRIRGTRHRSIS